MSSQETTKDGSETQAEARHEQFSGTLIREVAQQVTNTLESLQQGNRALSTKAVTPPLLTEEDRKTIEGITRGAFVRNAEVIPAPEPVRFPALAVTCRVTATKKAPHGRDMIFSGQTAAVLERCAPSLNRVCTVALGLYLDRRFTGSDIPLSICEVATMAGVCHGHARRELRGHWKSGWPRGWSIVFESDGEHFTLEHDDDYDAIAKHSFRRLLENCPHRLRVPLLAVFTQLIERYLTDGRALSVEDIRRLADIEDPHAIEELMQPLQDAPRAALRRRYQPDHLVVIEGDTMNGWYLREPGRKTLLTEIGRQPIEYDK